MAGAFQHTLGGFQSDYQYTQGVDSHDLPIPKREWPKTQVIRQSDLKRKLGILPGKRIPARQPAVEYEYVEEGPEPGPSPEQLAEDDRVITEYMAQSYIERQAVINQALAVISGMTKETLH